MCFTEKPEFRHFSLEKQTLMKKILTETHFIGPRFIILSMVKCKLPKCFFRTSFLCVFLKVDSAKSFKILSEAHPRAYLVANRISWKPNPQQSDSVQKGRPFSSRTNNYKNMRPGRELKLAMSPSCDWQQSEVTPVISPRASPIFNSQIIPDTFPELAMKTHFSTCPHFRCW